VSYLGYVYGTMAALNRMLPRDAGTIVQVGSALAYRGIPLQSAYCGAKHAIQGFNESLGLAGAAAAAALGRRGRR
jgi:short-subunit dehydrogenase